MFKIGDKVVCVDSFSSHSYLKEGEIYEIEETINGGDIKVKGIYFYWSKARFELVQEEQPTKHLKQNWSIRVHSKEQAEVYEKTLIALGYVLTTAWQRKWRDDTYCLRYGSNYFWHSNTKNEEGTLFNNLESFLAWHFQEEETEQQKQLKEQLKELEETIARAQEQIEQLKKGL